MTATHQICLGSHSSPFPLPINSPTTSDSQTRFRNSYDAESQRANTGYYVSIFIDFFKSLGLSKLHLLGHDPGASLATELTVLHPTCVLSPCLVRTAIMLRDKQIALNNAVKILFNEPVPSGSHLQKICDYLTGVGVGDDLMIWVSSRRG
jgi:hypothetical protein